MAEQTATRTTAKLDGTTQDNIDVGLYGGRVRVICDTLEATALADGDTIWIARLPSNARILNLSEFSHDDLASTGSPTFDIGTFNPTGKSGITDDDNSINDGIDVATAAGSNLKLLAAHANAGKYLYELAGESTDPKQDIDIKITNQDAATNTTGTVTWEVFYTID